LELDGDVMLSIPNLLLFIVLLVAAEARIVKPKINNPTKQMRFVLCFNRFIFIINILPPFIMIGIICFAQKKLSTESFFNN